MSGIESSKVYKHISTFAPAALKLFVAMEINFDMTRKVHRLYHVKHRDITFFSSLYNLEN